MLTIINWSENNSIILDNHQKILDSIRKESDKFALLEKLTTWHDSEILSQEYKRFPMEDIMKKLLEGTRYGIREISENEKVFSSGDFTLTLIPEKKTMLVTYEKEHDIPDIPRGLTSYQLSVCGIWPKHRDGELSAHEAAVAMTEAYRPDDLLEKAYAYLQHRRELSREKRGIPTRISRFQEYQDKYEEDVRKHAEGKKERALDISKGVKHLYHAGIVAFLKELEKKTKYRVLFKNMPNPNSLQTGTQFLDQI